MTGDLVSGEVEPLDQAVVRPLVRHEERSADRTAVRIGAIGRKHSLQKTECEHFISCDMSYMKMFTFVKCIILYD